jgi:hypothetical protein
MAGVIYDKDGNIVGTSTNIDRFIVNKQGQIINPSTEELLIDIKNNLNTTNDAKLSELAKENTLSSINSKIQTTTNGIKVDGSNVIQPVNVTQSVLPQGAATEYTLSQINNKLTSQNGLLKVDASSTTLTISANSLPLPNGAAKDSTLTDGSQKTQITKGTNIANVNSDGTLDINLKRIDADIYLSYQDDSVQIYGYDGTTYKPIKVDSNGNVSVNINNAILPNNAATESTLSAIYSNITGPLALENGNLATIKDTINTINSKIDNLARQNTLSSIDSKLVKTNVGILIDGSQYTQDVNVVSSVLPTNAANATNQQTIISKLNDIYNTVASEVTLAYINSKISVDSNNKIKVNADGSNVTATIVSSVLPTGAATDNTLINGNAKFRILDNNGNPITSTNGALDVNIKSGAEISVNLNAANDSVLIYGYDQTSGNYNPIKVDQNGFILINKDGLATSVNQNITNTYLNEINSKIATENTLSQINNKLSIDTNNNLKVNVTNSNLNVNVVSSVLPTGAATSTNQNVTNSLLTDIKNKIPNDANGYLVINKDGLATSANQTQIYNILDDKFDVELSTRASEATLSNVNSNVVLVKNSVDTANTNIVNAITPKATENTLQTVNSNVVALSSKLDEVKSSIVNQLDWRVRGLFDNNGNPIDSILLSILNKRGIFNIDSILEQYLTFNKQMFYYTYSVNVNGNDTNLLALINPSNSGKIFLINRIIVARNQDNSNSVTFRINFNASNVTGTQRTPLSTIQGGTSSSILYTAPTATNMGSQMLVLGINAYESSKDEDLDLEFGLNPGENLFIIGNASANGTPCYITIEWAEV